MANPIHQFEITPIRHFEVGGVDLSFTNSSLWMMIAVIVATAFFLAATSKTKLLPGRLQAMAEMMYNIIHKMVEDNIGHKGMKYFPFIFTIFIVVLMGNLLGLLPYSFTYTSHLAVTGALALGVFATVIIMGFVSHGPAFLSMFVPAGLPIWLMPFIIPIEVVSFFVRPLTLAVRLFANMMAGHIMLKVVAGFAIAAALSMGTAGMLIGAGPVLINTIMMAFELLVALIQAYVFAILTCVYLKDTVELHGHH